MNLMLIRGGYPPVAVRPEDRSAHLDGLERAPLTDDHGAFQRLLHERLDATFADYLVVLGEALAN